MNSSEIKNTKLHFILSTERTGSTLLSTMLNMHPNVLSTFEESFAFTLYPKYKNVTNWTSETIKQYCYDFYLFSEGYLEIQFGSKKDFIALLEKNKPDLTCDLVFKLSYFNFFPKSTLKLSFRTFNPYNLTTRGRVSYCNLHFF